MNLVGRELADPRLGVRHFAPLSESNDSRRVQGLDRSNV